MCGDGDGGVGVGGGGGGSRWVGGGWLVSTFHGEPTYIFTGTLIP